MPHVPDARSADQQTSVDMPVFFVHQENAMIETGIFLLICIIIGCFYYDIRRKSLRHQNCVSEEKSDIATITRMTASMSTFSNGTKTTEILAASDELMLFFYRKVVNGKLVARYAIHLPNITAVRLLLNGKAFGTNIQSYLKTPTQCATDISTQAIQGMDPAVFNGVQSIVLEVHFLSENPQEKQEKALPIPIFKAGSPELRKQLPKILENALWWNSFLPLASAEAQRMESLEKNP